MLYGYRGRPQKSQASPGVEDGAGKKLLFWVRRWGRNRRPETP